jgi:hypothetical protein
MSKKSPPDSAGGLYRHAVLAAAPAGAEGTGTGSAQSALNFFQARARGNELSIPASPQDMQQGSCQSRL